MSRPLPYTLVSVQNVSPTFEDYWKVVQDIRQTQENSQAVCDQLSQLAPDMDDDQAAHLEASLRNRNSVTSPEEPHDPYTEVRVGYTWLHIPPSHIKVSEVRYNEEIPGLRTSSSALVKSGRGQIRIDLVVDFVGESAINEQLRTVIAQFRTSPFLPIESHYIFNAIMAEMGKIPPKTVDDMNLKISRLYDEYKKIQVKMVDELLSNEAFVRLSQTRSNVDESAIRNRLLGLLPDEILSDISDVMTRNEVMLYYDVDIKEVDAGFVLGSRVLDRRLMDALGNSTLTSMSNINTMAQEANKLLKGIRDLHIQLMDAGVAAASRRAIVPVIMNTLEIQTVPGEIDSLRVVLSLIYFSYGAYVMDFAYKNNVGGPTLDIGQCPWYEAYVRRRYLGGTNTSDVDLVAKSSGGYLGKFRSDAGQAFRFQYPTPKFEEMRDDPSSTDLMPAIPANAVGPNRATNLAGKSGSTKSYLRPIAEELDIEVGDKNIIPDQIAIVIQNRIAIQPIQGSLYGTAQHMGAINAKVTVAFTVVGDNKFDHDWAVGKIHRMKLMTDQASMVGGPRVRRNSRIRVWNDLLALAGVRSVQIDGITTKTNPGEQYSSTIQLDMTEYSVSQEKREKIRLKKRDGRTSLSQASLQYAVKVADQHLRGEKSTQKGMLSPDNAGLYCYTMLYGTGKEGDRGILTPEVVTDILLNDPTTVSAVRRYLQEQYNKAIQQRDEEIARRSQSRNRMGYGSDVLNPGYTSKLMSDSVNYDELYQRAVDRQTSFLNNNPGPELKIFSNIKKPTDSDILNHVKRLADESIQFWKMPKVIVAGLVPTIPTVKKDTSGILEIQSTPSRYVQDVIYTLLKPDYPREFSRLQTLADYSLENFPEVRAIVLAEMEDSRARSNYPDLCLPTYSEMFFGSAEMTSELTKSLDTAPGGPKDASYAMLRVYTASVLGAKTLEVMRRFMPTWRDLGKRAPLNQDEYSLAKSVNDYVDPDFFYFHNRISSFYKNQEEEFSKEADSLYESPARKLSYAASDKTASKADRASAKRMQRMRDASSEISRKQISGGDPSEVTKNMDLIPNPDGSYAAMQFKNGVWRSVPPVEGYGNTPMHSYKPGDPKLQKLWGDLQHDDPVNLKSLFREVNESMKDDRERIVRAFPTFKFYFIEEDNEEWGYWDDFYSYNAVVDFQISEHKFEPTLLQIRIVNTTGNLDEARSSTEDPDRLQEDLSWTDKDNKFVDPLDPPRGPGIERGTGERRELSQFFLQTGTPIMLKVGYGSSEDDLETKFVGHIVEIDPGDVITIIAQSYKNELTVPLNTYKSGSESDPFNVIKWVMDESPTIHFGKWSPYGSGLIHGYTQDGQEYNQDSYEKVGWGGYRGGSADGGKSESEKQAGSVYEDWAVGADAAKVGGIILALNPITAPVGIPLGLAGFGGDYLVDQLSKASNWYAKISSDRKMGNVYLPRQSYWRNLFSTSREFLIPDSTGLEVLHELTRHIPGFVFDVRPYDHNVTLFFGKPEQRYFYTGGKQDEEKMWTQYQAKAEKPNEQIMTRVIIEFEGSIWGTTWKSIFRARHTAGRELQRGLARYAGAIPGKVLGRLTFGLLGGDYEKAGKVAGQDAFGGYRESPDVTSELQYIESHLGVQNLKVLTTYFFNRFTYAFGSGDQAIEGVIAASKLLSLANPISWVTSPLKTAETILNPIETVKTAAGAATGAYNMVAGLTEDPEAVASAAQLAKASKDLPGSVFASLDGWRDKLDQIAQKNDGTNQTQRNIRLYFEKSTDFKAFDTMQDTNSGVTDRFGNQIPRATHDRMVESIIDVLPEWKQYIAFLKYWIMEQINTGNTDLLKEAYKAGRLAERYEHNPRTKRFRDHHFVDSIKHIIKNGIVATKEQMANTVIIKYPDDVDYNEGGGRYFVAQDIDWQTLELMADQNIIPSEKKVRIITELNADDSQRAELAAYSNLAEALRPMYRGELIVRGNEKIKPHDIVWINDPYENIYGPIEVERVITHFGMDTGYLTTIIPQAVCIPMTRSSWMDALVCGQLNFATSALYIGLGTVAGAVGGSILGLVGVPLAGAVAGGASGGPMGFGLGVAGGVGVGVLATPITTIAGAGVGLIGTAVYENWKLQEESGVGLWGNLTGRGRYGRMQTPVDIVPLVRNGMPWTAGLRGWSDDNWMVRMGKKWSYFKRGLGIASDFADDLYSDAFPP